MTDQQAEITFRSDMDVRLVRQLASDADVVGAARVSTMGGRLSAQEGEPEPVSSAGAKLIDFLMRNRHGSPFEHGQFTWLVEAPIFVFRELMRHRIASYNEESGRYRVMRPVFYLPPSERKLVQVGKAGEYTLESGTLGQYHTVVGAVSVVAGEAWEAYTAMLEAGVAREVARIVLPVNLYSSAWVTMNPRALMNFLSLRVNDPNSAYPSFPMREIELVARAMENDFAEAMPVTHGAFVQQGRVAP